MIAFLHVKQEANNHEINGTTEHSQNIKEPGFMKQQSAKLCLSLFIPQREVEIAECLLPRLSQSSSFRICLHRNESTIKGSKWC